MEQAFQIVSVDRALTNWGHCHITDLDTAPKPGSPDRWPITWVLGALAGGDLFYTITERGGLAFARSYRCICGFATIRTTPSDEMNDGLESVSMEEWQGLSAAPSSLTAGRVSLDLCARIPVGFRPPYRGYEERTSGIIARSEVAVLCPGNG